MDVSSVVFDFDNVITLQSDGTGSDEVKDAMWPKVFGADWERIKDEFPLFIKHWSGGKGSRFEIVRDALNHLGFRGDLQKEVEKLCEDFNRLVQEGIVEMGVLSETHQFLEKLSKRFPLFVNSATPTGAMSQTLEKLHLRHLFTNVYGQEEGKAQSLRRAMKEVGEIDYKKILFVGDALTDYEAAQAVGTQFVGIATKRNGWIDGKEPFPVVTTISELQL
ncbi:MAG: HAD hydrolase-like protein [bacterium]|nr:HAD hydrolase-like protein [bacterium]